MQSHQQQLAIAAHDSLLFAAAKQADGVGAGVGGAGVRLTWLCVAPLVVCASVQPHTYDRQSHRAFRKSKQSET